MMKKNAYAGKSALVTGGSSGIGFAIAKQLVEAGANVTILARRLNLLTESAQILETSRISPDQQILTLQADITHFDELNAVLDQFKAQHGVPDLVVNSAGVAHPGNFTATDISVFHWMMDVNYFGTVNVLKNLVPDMIKRKSGTIINISSMAGFIGVYGYSAYGASKYAVAGFSDVLRSELKIRGIQVSVVFPPDTQTPQLEYESKIKPFITKEIGGSANLMSADEVARHVLEKTAQGKYIILPGSEAKLIFKAQNIVGAGIYPIMDLLVKNAIGKLKLGR